MSKKLSRRKRKISNLKKGKIKHSDNFDAPINNEAFSTVLSKDNAEKITPRESEESGDSIYNPSQIRKSFLSSVLIFAIMFVLVIAFHFLDQKYDIIQGALNYFSAQ